MYVLLFTQEKNIANKQQPDVLCATGVVVVVFLLPCEDLGGRSDDSFCVCDFFSSGDQLTHTKSTFLGQDLSTVAQ